MKRLLRKINLAINKNPEVTSIVIGIILLGIVAAIYNDFKNLSIVFLGVVLFGILIGLISALVKIFFK